MQDNLGAMELAYLAGLFDGEGSVSIALLKGKRRQQPMHALSVQMAICDAAAVARLHRAFSGDLRKERKRKGHHQTSWRWRVQGKRAVNALKALLPYLSIKLPQALLGIEFYETKTRYHRTPEHEIFRRESYRQRMWALNGYSTKKRNILRDLTQEWPPQQWPQHNELGQLYLDQQLTSKEIAQRYNVHPASVLAWLKKAGIPRRKRGWKRPDLSERNRKLAA